MSTRRQALTLSGTLTALLILVCPGLAAGQQATQLQFTEDFTHPTTTNQWYFFNGACLTAGTTLGAQAGAAGKGNGCTAIDSSYYNGEPLVGGAKGTSGPTQTLPDTDGNGALRLTNGCTNESGKGCGDSGLINGPAKTHTGGGGHNQNGAIISSDTLQANQGVNITFKTVTYRGDTGAGGDGADGISFFLMDGSFNLDPTKTNYYADNFGAFGGSLGYTCNNGANDDQTQRSDGTTRHFDGIAGGYIALGIDEWGNFLNGTTNTLGETGTNATSDNTASGGGYQPGRVGLRGAGSIAWKWLTTTQPGMYPPTLSASLQSQAVANTCKSGVYYDYSSMSGGTATSTAAPDYNALAYKVVQGTFTIANESAVKRGTTTVAADLNDPTTAVPITYNLKISKDNLLSLAYSYNGGAYQPVITSQSIQNGTPPQTYRFGFAGSTGGSSNIHEIMCFKATPDNTSQSSGSVNVFENPTLKPGTQMYLAYYSPSDWTGRLTAQAVGFDTMKNQIVVAPTPTWDAQCVLSGSSGTNPCSTGSTNTPVEAPASRHMITWDGKGSGIPFEAGSLAPNETAALTAGDPTQNSNRLSYLRGDTTNEISPQATCNQLTSSGMPCFRKRDGILGDIVHSSPTWVGPAQTYDLGTTFQDKLNSNATPTETSYDAFRQAQQGRQNVVYVGANDGFVHGFRAGYMDATGAVFADAARPNDGVEILAYMPAAVLNSIHNTSQVELDYSNTQYAHNWFVDATPGTGDLFYNGAWHTWLVGGLGQGGAAIYALDITSPTNINPDPTAADPTAFSENNAKNIVVGEWSAANITCPHTTNCQNNLGNTYGTPLIRRFHNGQWGVIFGNGYGTNAAGIFILLMDPNNGPTFYYLGTPATGAANGIAYTAAADLDLDHIVDFIYAGDLQGNVWRFDVTNADPTQWVTTNNAPLFSTGGAPISAGITVSVLRQFVMTNLGGTAIDTTKPGRVIINFGTGQETPQGLATPETYAMGTQYLFGVWDWNFNTPVTGWNAKSNTPAVAMDPAGGKNPGLWPIPLSTLQSHTINTVNQTSPALSYRTVSQEPICWVVYEALDGSSACGNPGTQYGWVIPLPGPQEQVIFSPVLSPDGELVINTFIPANDSPLSCAAQATSTGFTMALMPGTGSADPGGTGSAVQSYFAVNTNNGTSPADGVQLNGTGVPWFLSSGQRADNNAQYLLTQTPGGAATPVLTNRHVVVSGKRLNWIQRR